MPAFDRAHDRLGVLPAMIHLGQIAGIVDVFVQGQQLICSGRKGEPQLAAFTPKDRSMITSMNVGASKRFRRAGPISISRSEA